MKIHGVKILEHDNTNSLLIKRGFWPSHDGLLFIGKCHIHNIFITNYGWKVVIGSNLNSKFKLLFYPFVITNNNLSLKICCKNIVDIIFLLFIKPPLKQENQFNFRPYDSTNQSFRKQPSIWCIQSTFENYLVDNWSELRYYSKCMQWLW